jgi:hypothetical protein
VSWLSTLLSLSREEAVSVARQLMYTSHFCPITRDSEFEDKAVFYQVTRRSIKLNAGPDLTDASTPGSSGDALELKLNEHRNSLTNLKSVKQLEKNYSAQLSPTLSTNSDALDFIIHLIELLLSVYRNHRLELEMFGNEKVFY